MARRIEGGRRQRERTERRKRRRMQNPSPQRRERERERERVTCVSLLERFFLFCKIVAIVSPCGRDKVSDFSIFLPCTSKPMYWDEN